MAYMDPGYTRGGIKCIGVVSIPMLTGHTRGESVVYIG